MARIIGEARRERVQERTVQALIACEGWMTVSELHRGAYGGDSVTAAERDEALGSLLAAHIIESRLVSKTVGRFGRTTTQYRYRAVGTALSTEPCQRWHMDDLDLDTQLALVDLAVMIVTRLAATA